MAIEQGLCNSFKQELFLRFHDMDNDVLKMALYLGSASIGTTTTVYTTSGETSGTNYVAGGVTLTNVVVALSNGVAYVDFDDVTWANATFSAAGALIYNETRGNKAVAVLDFGGTKTKTASSFVVQLPPANSTTALIRIE